MSINKHIILTLLLGLSISSAYVSAAPIINVSKSNNNMPINPDNAPICPTVAELYNYVTDITGDEYNNGFVAHYKFEFGKHTWEGSHIWMKPVQHQPNPMDFLQTELADFIQGSQMRAIPQNYMGYDVWVCMYKVPGAASQGVVPTWSITSHIEPNERHAN